MTARAFTLIEVTIMALVLGIVGALAAPLLNASLIEAKLSAAADEIAAALKYAQLTATGGGAITRVRVLGAADMVLVERFVLEGSLLGSETELDDEDVEDGEYASIAHPVRRGEDYKIDLKNESRFGDVEISSADFGGASEVTFDAQGVPDSGGTITLTLGARQVVLTLDGVTGKVTRTD